MLCVAKGLSFLASKHLAHGDLKSPNILLSGNDIKVSLCKYHHNNAAKQSWIASLKYQIFARIFMPKRSRIQNSYVQLANSPLYLFCCHDKGLVLQIAADGDLLARFNLQIADVGLGKLVHGPHVTASSIGTFAWAAPEQLCGRIGVFSDIWSMGVCLWEVNTSSRKLDLTPLRQATLSAGGTPYNSHTISYVERAGLIETQHITLFAKPTDNQYILKTIIMMPQNTYPWSAFRYAQEKCREAIVFSDRLQYRMKLLWKLHS